MMRTTPYFIWLEPRFSHSFYRLHLTKALPIMDLFLIPLPFFFLLPSNSAIGTNGGHCVKSLTGALASKAFYLDGASVISMELHYVVSLGYF